MTDTMKQFSDRERKAGESLRNTWQSFAKSKRGQDVIPRPEAVIESAMIAETQAKNERELMAKDNVVGVGVGLKTKGGKPSENWCVLVLVEKKVAKDKLSKAALVPEMIDGVPTDVIEVGPVEALAFDTKLRPAQPGFSIGHYNITAGTFGCLVRDMRAIDDADGNIRILSNNHVLANTNAANIGDAILQPGPFDGGEFPGDSIATLDRFEEIVFGASGYNLIDAALAKPTASRNVIAAILGLVVPTGLSQALPLDPVLKVGRTTEVTAGTVIATNATISVGYGAAGVAQFRHQILTTAMAAGGDSGSLLMNQNLEAVGLLFAGSAVVTIHNHIADVQNGLGVEVVTA